MEIIDTGCNYYTITFDIFEEGFWKQIEIIT